YKAELAEPLPIAPPRVRALAVDEIAAQLGVVALIDGNYKDSEELFKAALAANPRNGPALAGMGDVHKQAERFEQAEQNYERAVAAEPMNPNHELDWGEYFLQRAVREADADRRRALLADARRHFARSYAIDPKNPETLDQNGETYLFDGEDGAKAVQSLEAAYDLLPSYQRIQLDLARAYVKTGERAAARALLARVVTWSHGEPSAELKELLASAGVDAALPKDDDAEASGAKAAER
ncbi:MAG TPA: tetratricopeptide repeat protein, partial [Gammaproteobacteria bacterium]|nr:tetratricopeptide repeat protein [Gammaproteobacteria bacterium]